LGIQRSRDARQSRNQDSHNIPCQALPASFRTHPVTAVFASKLREKCRSGDSGARTKGGQGWIRLPGSIAKNGLFPQGKRRFAKVRLASQAGDFRLSENSIN